MVDSADLAVNALLTCQHEVVIAGPASAETLQVRGELIRKHDSMSTYHTQCNGGVCICSS
jgi:hypothetical protein